MVNPWALALPVLLLGIIAYRWFKEAKVSGETVYVAHTLPGRILPRYRARIRQLKLASALTFLLLAAVAVSAAVLVARPHSTEVRDEQLASRDIVICLDVSGSVISFDSEVMEEFAAMVDDFRGERVGLVIWNSDSQVVFPLTNDYDLVERRLLEGAEALETEDWSDYPSNPDLFYDFTAGTFLESTGGASLVEMASSTVHSSSISLKKSGRAPSSSPPTTKCPFPQPRSTRSLKPSNSHQSAASPSTACISRPTTAPMVMRRLR